MVSKYARFCADLLVCCALRLTNNNTALAGNLVYEAGAGLAVDGFGSAELHTVTVTSNIALPSPTLDVGFGVGGAGVAGLPGASIAMKGCTITGNIVEGNGTRGGGGLLLDLATATVEGMC